MSVTKPNWSGVFPAATTQFTESGEVDIAATQKVQEALLNDGVDGLVVLGTVGENNSLSAKEKQDVLAAACEVAKGRAPVITGVSEFTTGQATEFAKNAEKIGVNGLMLLPAMVYVPTTAELVAHISQVSKSVNVPVMLYNNPHSYRVSIDMETLKSLSKIDNIVAIKESTPDSRRFTDVINEFGDRFLVFAGLDDIALEGLMLGACGWVSGLTNAFPEESVALVAAARAGDYEKALKIYRWFMPLLHLDAEHDLVQSIKLAEQIMGRGSERVRMPRMPLTGARRDYVTKLVETAAKTRPL